MPIIDQRSTKITETHLQKTTYVYLRQSSMGQVRNHRESTEQLNGLVKDPDAQVRSSIELVFDYFQQCGSAYGVVLRFAREKPDFPKRSYGGTWAGRLVWGRLTDARVTSLRA